jgi:hypothetical protein
MAKRAVPATATDEEIRVLLEHYRCPVPFYEVRVRFLGNIATPAVGVSPIEMVERLWSGDLPEFNSIDAANELIGALIMGLWNRLTRHQERSAPFRLVRPDVMATQEGLATLAMIRCQELDGFVEGLFGDEETIGLPERAHRGLETLSEMPALMAAVVQMASDETKRRPTRTFKPLSGTCVRRRRLRSTKSMPLFCRARALVGRCSQYCPPRNRRCRN